MRVLIWNMAAAFAPSHHEEAWRHLVERDDFDVALLQEAQEPPTWTHSHWASWVWRPKHAQRRRNPWGSAVVARDLRLESYEPDESFPWLKSLAGSTAIARATGEPRWLVSAHLTARRVSAALLATHSLKGVEVTTRDKSIWETNVVPHELHRLFGDDTFIWGGDLNSDPKMDQRSGFAGGNQRIFDIYRDAGSIDLRSRFHDTNQQTFFRPKTDSYQLDHVFADEVTERRVESWAVDPRPATGDRPLSDHAPILVEINDDSATRTGHEGPRAEDPIRDRSDDTEAGTEEPGTGRHDDYFLVDYVDDGHARALLMYNGILLVDNFREAIEEGRAVDHALSVVPSAYASAIDETVAVRLYAAASALMARLSCGRAAACVAEEMLAAFLVIQCLGDLEYAEEWQHQTEAQRQSSVRALDGVFDLFQDDEAIGLYGAQTADDMTFEMAAADVAGWFEPFAGVHVTGHLDEDIDSE